MGIFDRIFQKQIDQAVRDQLAVVENENTFFIGTRPLSQSERDRFTYDCADILEQSLEAWRLNPLARRIVELTSQYVVGGGLTINCKDSAATEFLGQFWSHRLNRMPVRVSEMCDELSRTGNLFVILTTDAAGMSYIRLMPASHIDEIIAKPNDIEQPLMFKLKADLENLSPEPIPAYDPLKDNPAKPVILQYAINRPAGAQWGEPDIAPCWCGSQDTPTGCRTGHASIATAMLFSTSSRPSLLLRRRESRGKRPSMPTLPSPDQS